MMWFLDPTIESKLVHCASNLPVHVRQNHSNIMMTIRHRIDEFDWVKIIGIFQMKILRIREQNFFDFRVYEGLIILLLIEMSALFIGTGNYLVTKLSILWEI